MPLRGSKLPQVDELNSLVFYSCIIIIIIISIIVLLCHTSTFLYIPLVLEREQVAMSRRVALQTGTSNHAGFDLSSHVLVAGRTGRASKFTKIGHFGYKSLF